MRVAGLWATTETIDIVALRGTDTWMAVPSCIARLGGQGDMQSILADSAQPEHHVVKQSIIATLPLGSRTKVVFEVFQFIDAPGSAEDPEPYSLISVAMRLNSALFGRPMLSSKQWYMQVQS